MSLVLAVLKIIGIVLLCLVLLVLALLLLVLFCPFCYRVRGSFREKQPEVQVRVLWLGVLLGFFLVWSGEAPQMYLRICGIRIRLGAKKKAKKKAADAPTKDTPQKELPASASLQAAESRAESTEDAVLQEPDAEEEKPEKKRFWEKLRQLPSAVRAFFDQIRGALKKGKKTAKRVLSIVQDERNHAALAKLLEEGKRLLAALWPRRFRLSLSYSAGAPDTTGQVLGVFAMLPVTYRQRWDIRPDFEAESAYADAEFDIRGRIFVIRLLLPVLRIILDKNCKRLYNKIRHR